MRPGLLVAALMLTAALPAAAQQTLPPSPAPASPEAAAEGNGGQLPEMDKLMKYVGTPEYFKNISTVVLGGEQDIAPECKAPKVLGRVGFVVLGLPHFEGEGVVPVSGRWKDQIAVNRCGPHVVHNVFVTAQGDGPHVGLLLPGETGLTAEMQMKGQGVKEAFAAAMTASGCSDPAKIIVTNTKHDKLLEEIKANQQGRVTNGKWRELWSFRACGKPQSIALTVTVGAEDVSFSAEPAKGGEGKKKK